MPPEAGLTHRRGLLAGGLAAAASLVARPAWSAATDAAFRAIEARTGGRLGVSMTRQGDTHVGWRENERFLMCSTFKALAVAAVLARVDHGAEKLDRWITYGAADMQPYAPVAKANLAKGGMTLSDLCAAAVELSDNTAANLILSNLGGPAAVTRYIRSLGDQTTRLDRNEPALNTAKPGTTWDTTTPASMVGLWSHILLGKALSEGSRRRLSDWLAACQTGPARLPAALSKTEHWRIGHKTGSGSTTIGDVAIVQPGEGLPILIAVYLDVPHAQSDAHDAAIAEAGRIAMRRFRNMV
jgi:beta-lactamase class A